MWTFSRALMGAAFLLLAGPAAAQISSGSLPNPAYFFDMPGSTITRPADTTQYTPTATICQSKSTPCVPGTVSIGTRISGQGFINHVTLFKSGATLTNAIFTIWMFAQTPTLTTPTQQDNVAYSGPRSADAPNYIGAAVCSTAVATSDASPGAWFDCALSNPNTSGALVFQGSPAVPSVISFLISDSGATGYVPISAETFTPYFSGFY